MGDLVGGHNDCGSEHCGTYPLFPAVGAHGPPFAFHQIMTSAKQQKYFYRITSSAISFEVKGSESAGIGLHRYPSTMADILIGLGDINNRRSYIGKHHDGCIPILTPNILSHEEYRRFWITWHNDVVHVGYDGVKTPFLTQIYTDMNLCFITFFVIGSHDPVYWKFELPPARPKCTMKLLDGGQPVWAEENEHLPEDAIIGGYEDECLYIMRAHHENSFTPGKLNPYLGKGYLSWGGREYEKNDFEILCGYNYVWVPSYKDRIPSGAVVGGYSENSHECLYIGRANHDGHVIPGKVQVSHKCCYIPYKGREIRKSKYDILVNPQSDPRCLYEIRSESDDDDHDNNDLDNNDSDNENQYAF